ncbi:thermonuclease family protein [Gloeocapsa sp. PCC 73106]|uniref:thermonuclease family protein n=1 Tax=Gloeocapsa sp. PCC 73106 TaxID=102232 RepID=UPI0002AC2D9C|nr:thermonuclease family protein [Gloeocapsa sp. PCC 73106]ELR98523.1 micrococcal nuclease-like nuclease [Gloeocapsa sp. PCC 73106]
MHDKRLLLMNKSIIFIFLLLLSGCTLFDKNIVQVVSVIDGDTISAKSIDGEEIRVRLACIDAPEMSQEPWGKEAKNRLTKLVKPNTWVKLNVIAEDGYNRKVAEIYLYKSSLVNLKLVEEGKVFVYEHYLDDCDGDKYLKAQETAKKKQKGIWKEKQPQKPWLFRMFQKN